MSVDANVPDTVDLWGKVASDLQSDMEINGTHILGILNYIDDYSSAFPTGLDSGNYICLHFEANDPEAEIEVTITNPVTLDEDGIFVGRIADKDSQTITVVVSKEGMTSVTKVFDLTGLEVEDNSYPPNTYHEPEQPDPIPVVVTPIEDDPVVIDPIDPIDIQPIEDPNNP